MASKADPLSAREDDIHLLATFIHSAGSRSLVPEVFIRVMESESWIHWKSKLGKDVQPKDFKEFVETKYPEGIGTTMDELKVLVEPNMTAKGLYLQYAQYAPGGNNNPEGIGGKSHKPKAEKPIVKHNNVMIDKAKQGNGTDYALRKLRTDAPAIHAKVLAGELSPNAGMIEAGFRKPTCTVEASVDGFARYIVAHFSDEDRGEIVSILLGGLEG